MDRNKAAFKLNNFGPVYYLNMDEQPERKIYMEAQFKYWQKENYTRISAYDGREDDLSDIINCLLYTSPSPRDATLSRMPSSA